MPGSHWVGVLNVMYKNKIFYYTNKTLTIQNSGGRDHRNSEVSLLTRCVTCRINLVLLEEEVGGVVWVLEGFVCFPAKKE